MTDEQTTIEDSIVIGYVHPGVVTERFSFSLTKACLWQDNEIIDIITASSPRQHDARNSVIERFLESEGEWLMWLDTDQTFKPAAMKELRDSAKANGADMVGGMGFFVNRNTNKIIPNAYSWDDEEKTFKETEEFTSGHVYEIDGTGAGFVLIHRRVFEAWDKPRWHENWFEHPGSGKSMGHDLAFFWRAIQIDRFKLIWDTSIPTGHVKSFELDEGMYRAYRESMKQES